MNGASVTVSGEAFDNRLVGAVFLWHGLVGADDPQPPSRDNDTGTYLPGGYTQLAGRSLWNTTINTTAETSTPVDGYRIRVVAIDNIGNVGTPEERLVRIDQAADRPVIAYSNLSTDPATPSRLGTNAQVFGTITDDDGVDNTSIQVRIDRNGDGDFDDTDEVWVNVSRQPSSEALVVTWYHDVSTLTQGKKYIEVRAYDIRNTGGYTTDYATDYTRGVTNAIEFYIDYGPPTLLIDSPTSGELLTVASFNVSGTTNDGNGVDYYTVWVDNDNDQTQDAGELTTVGWVDDNLDGIRQVLEIRALGTDTATGPITTDASVHTMDVTISGLSNGTKPIQITSYDIAGAATVRDLTIVIDTLDPTASISTPSAGATVNGTMTVSGLASDGYQLANVYYNIDLTTATPTFPDNYTALDQTYSWSFDYDTSALNGAYTIRIVPVDLAGNFPVSPVTRAITINQETDRPKIQVTSITEGNTAIQNLLPADKVITGSVQDDDGVDGSSIQVQILNAAGDTILTDWTNATNRPSNGTFVIWSHTVGRSDGQYQIRVRAYDIYSSDYTGFGYDDRFQVYVEDGDGGTNDSNGTSFAIDSANPTIIVTKPSQNFYTNGNEDKNANGVLDSGEDDDNDTTLDAASVIPFFGTASDGSGINSAQVSYRLQGDENFTTVATAGTTGWSASLSTAALADGIYDWRIEVTDPYGKSGITDRIFTVDKTPPAVVISTPTAGATLNGSLLISGTATDKWQTTEDGFQVTSVRIWLGSGAAPTPPAVTTFYTRSDGTNTKHDATHWKELTGTSSWSYRFNSTGINSDYTIFVAAVDNSGNVSTPVSRTITFDQSGNIPVITINNADGSVLGIGGTISGTITDDDNVDVSTMEISFDNGSSWNLIQNRPASDTVSATFSHPVTGLGITDTEGTYQVLVRASDVGEDYAGTIDDIAAILVTTTPAVGITYDKAPPAVLVTGFEIDNPFGALTTVFDAAGELNGTLVNGGFWVSGTASDGTSVSSVVVTFDGTPYATTYVAGTGTWETDMAIVIDESMHTDDGPQTITVVATDSVGKSTTTTVQIVIDTKVPVISPVSPAGIATADPPNVNGLVIVQGTVTDSSAITAFTALGGIVNAPTSPVSLTNSGNALSWIFNIDTYDYEDDYTAYATDIDGAGPGMVYRFPITISVTDAAGNEAQASYAIDIDPNSDKPIVSVASPADESSVGGTIVAQGSVTDDDAPAYVTIQVDLNDDGIYGADGGFDGTLDLNGDGIVDPYEDETVPVTSNVTNGSWNAILNDDGELNQSNLILRGLAGATGWIRILITPYDNNTPAVAGDPAEIRIYIDSTAPIIRGRANGTPITSIDVLPSPASGSVVRSDRTIEATFQDDKALSTSRMQISLDGGLSYQTIASAGGTVTPYSLDGGVYDGLYTYLIAIPIDTTTAIAGGNGTLQIVLKVTDETFKQITSGIELAVDNTLPTVVWDTTLPHVGATGSEIYTYAGNATVGGDYRLGGIATDLDSIAEVDRIDVHFVRGGLFYNPTTGAASDEPATTALTDDELYDQTGTLVLTADNVPYTTDSTWIVSIDNRLEQGLTDSAETVGDGDGFLESLKSQGASDAWYAEFDTTVFPDGQIDIYFVVYDTAGNKSYDMVYAQMANNPPSIDSLEIDGKTLTSDGRKVRPTGTATLVINASDAESIVSTGFRVTVAGEYAPDGSGNVGVRNTLFTPFSYGTAPSVRDFTSTTGGTTAIAELSIDTVNDGYTDGYWYEVVAETTDSDGNVDTMTFYLWVNNADGSEPSATIDPFDQTNVTGNGHIDASGESPDGVADLSGTVFVTGTAADNGSIDHVTASYWNTVTSSWTTIGTATNGAGLTLVSEDPDTGWREYSWSVTWNTAGIPGVADSDVVIRAIATDGIGNSTGDGTTDPTPETIPEVTVDVVPYITDITGAGFDSGLLVHLKRSATGVYPVREGITELTIHGFNLPATGDALNYVDLNDGAVTLNPKSGSTTAIVIDLTGITASGPLAVVTNSVNSTNNSNRNQYVQNQEPSIYNSGLFDDRELVFWQVTPVSATATVVDATMRPNAAGNDFDWMYVKSGKMLYLRDSAGTEKMITEGTALRGGSFTYNEDGRLVFVYNHNGQWTPVNNSYAFTGSVQYGLIPDVSTYTYSTTHAAYNWNNSLGFVKLGVGNVSFSPSVETLPAVLDDPYPYSNLDLNRYENIKLVTIGDGTVGGDAINRNYVAYFDTGASESRSIVFYGFQTGTAAASVTSTARLYQNEDLLNAGVDVTLNTDGTNWYANLDKYYESNGENDTVVLAGTATKNDVGIVTPRGRQEVTEADSGNDSSQFDLAVYNAGGSSHIGFIAYFDESNDGRNLLITANPSLYTADPTGALGTWSLPTEVDSDGGSDVAMAVDDAGVIHLAYQSNTGYLKYARVTYSGGSFDVGTPLFVDALFGAGSKNAITIRNFGTELTPDYRPIITTYSTAVTGTKGAVRISYPLSSVATVGAGANSSTMAFTGAWETVALPAVSSPELKPMQVYLDTNGRPHLGYDTSAGLEEATYFGF